MGLTITKLKSSLGKRLLANVFRRRVLDWSSLIKVIFLSGNITFIRVYLSNRPQVSMVYLSNRPQVSMVYRLINHAECW